MIVDNKGLLLTTKEASIIDTYKAAYRACHYDDRLFKLCLIESGKAVNDADANSILTSLKGLMDILL